MAVIAIRSEAWNALTEDQHRGLRAAADLPYLGEPALFLDENGVEWRVHDDHRISDTQVAIVAALMETPSLIEPIPEAQEATDV